VEASRFDDATAYAVFDRHTFGDMNPYVFKTSDSGRTWLPVIGPDSGVKGFAHVIKEDTVSPNLLFAGTEFGLWISLDAGKHWAQYKGGDFPNVPVRDIVVHPRESDLVLATHGRGIWIIDDISPLRQLTPQILDKDAVFLQGRVPQQRIGASGGYGEGDGTFVGKNPPDAALITYYQKKRHVFGRMKIEILNDKGELVDTLPANSRRGISRIEWAMRLKPPRVPPAAIAAGEATVGPRVIPGNYMVKLTRGKETYTTPLTLRIDPRATYTLDDRKAQFDAAMKVYALMEDLAFDVDRINAARTALLDRAAKLPAADPARSKVEGMASKLDEMRKKIVATKEGGAITGEERIREKTSQLYGAIVFYDGRPADYYIARIESLSHERQDVVDEFQAFVKGLQIPVLTREAWEKTSAGSDGGAGPQGSPAETARATLAKFSLR
jgi:hypothetical protein